MPHLLHLITARVTPGRRAGATAGSAQPEATAIGGSALTGQPLAVLLADQVVTRLGTDLDAGVRLRLRDHPALDALADALALARLVHEADQGMRRLDSAYADLLALSAGRGGGRAAGRAAELAHGRLLDQARGRAFTSALDLAGTLTEARVLARGLARSDDPGLRRAADLAALLDRAANHALDLGRDHPRRGGAATARRLARGVARAGGEAFAILQVAVTGVAAVAGFELDPGASRDLAHADDSDPLARLAEAGAALDAARTDFSHADLSDVDLSEVDLRGVVWSAQTAWPAEWAEWLRRASAEIAPGLFEVPRDGRPGNPAR